MLEMLTAVLWQVTLKFPPLSVHGQGKLGAKVRDQVIACLLAASKERRR